MKKLIALLLCIIFMLSLSACGDNETSDNSTQASTQQSQTSTKAPESDILPIIGTWVCEDISKDYYFIFDEKGDAYAKWGSSTVYGYYDYYEDENIYDIDIPNFLLNEYTLEINGDTMTLTSEESFYEFKKATMPEVTIKAPDNLNIDEKIIGNWQCSDNYEFYEFRNDNTATISDILNYATVDCKYDCKNGVVTFYAMATENKDKVSEIEYSITKDNKLKLGDFVYEQAQSN